jgi:aspartate aminotransferase
MDLVWATEGDVIGLHVGEPSFATPSHVVEATARALHEGATRYVPNAGIPELRGALVEKLRVANGIRATADDVVVTAGGMEAIVSALLAVMASGDEVLIPDPGWPNYAMLAGLLDVAPVPYALGPENAFLPSVDQLAELVTPRTRAIILNSPSNPLGTVLPASILHEIISFARERDIWIISDECYDAITFDVEHVSPASLDPTAPVLSCFTFSKSYSMTGFRVGYLVGPPGTGGVLAKLQEPLVACVNAAAQWGALAALTGPQDLIELQRAAYQERRDRACALLDSRGIGYVRPQGAFYLWVDVSSLTDSVVDFATRAVRERHVAVAPGTTFGRLGEGYVRVSLATDLALLLEGLERLITEDRPPG